MRIKLSYELKINLYNALYYKLSLFKNNFKSQLNFEYSALSDIQFIKI